MSRKSDDGPNYALLKDERELARIEKEIIQYEPKVEVTIEGSKEVATGRIVEWHANRLFFSVKWNHISAGFENQTESKVSLRVFFKAFLFSTQLLFKSTTLRRLGKKETHQGAMIYHYRIPEQIFNQQRRGALRVPLAKNAGILITPAGNFELLDLSATGAKLKITEPTELVSGTEWKSCELYFNKIRISQQFHVKITRVTKEWFGVKFTKPTAAETIHIKQFLLEALRNYYAKKFNPRA